MTIDYSVIIPAYNEEAYLPATLAALHGAMAGTPLAGEVIVVDNNSDDGTARIARDNDAIVVFEPVNQISRARNSGARQARGRYLIFLDADTTISGELLLAALAGLENGRCCGGGACVSADEIPPAGAQRTMELWNLLSVKLGLAAGCFIYCLREGFDYTGGFSERVYASEEIWFSRKLRSWGRGQGLPFHIITEPPVRTSIRKLHWYSQLRLVMLSAPVLLFPPAIFFKGLCSPWYRRPAGRSKISRF
jgi:glycosyltransferase involved in cell wall biosynthesis